MLPVDAVNRPRTFTHAVDVSLAETHGATGAGSSTRCSCRRAAHHRGRRDRFQTGPGRSGFLPVDRAAAGTGRESTARGSTRSATLPRQRVRPPARRTDRAEPNLIVSSYSMPVDLAYKSDGLLFSYRYELATVTSAAKDKPGATSTEDGAVPLHPEGKVLRRQLSQHANHGACLPGARVSAPGLTLARVRRRWTLARRRLLGSSTPQARPWRPVRCSPRLAWQACDTAPPRGWRPLRSLSGQPPRVAGTDLFPGHHPRRSHGDVHFPGPNRRPASETPHRLRSRSPPPLSEPTHMVTWKPLSLARHRAAQGVPLTDVRPPADAIKRRQSTLRTFATTTVLDSGQTGLADTLAAVRRPAV